MKRMKVNGITTGERVGVVGIVFESADVVVVFIDVSNQHPHPFGLLISPFGLFSCKAKKKLYIGTDFEITSQFFGRRVKIVTVLRHPNGVFKVIAIFRVRWKRVILLTFPWLRGRRAESTPTVGQIVQFVERRVTCNHASERYQTGDVWCSRIIR